MTAFARPVRTVLAAAVVLAVAGVAGMSQAATKPAAAGARSSSSFAYAEGADGRTVDIVNVAFAVTGSHLPGRPEEERLVLRTTVRSHAVIDEVGVESTVTVEAWPLGTDLGRKPAWAVTLDGVEAHIADGTVLVFDRGTEEVDWWSVYALGTGAFLFDTHVPPASFSITRDVVTLRYAGLEVPPDDAADARLRESHVVGVLAYAAPDAVRREALITCDDAERARLLRSYWDETRTLAVEEPTAPATAAAAPASEGALRALALRLVWAPANPADAETVSAAVPVAADDLDLAHATLPAGLHIAPWTR